MSGCVRQRARLKQSWEFSRFVGSRRASEVLIDGKRREAAQAAISSEVTVRHNW